MKRIEYRGGLVTFAVPDTWVAQYTPSGEIECFEPSDSTGATLRLSVLSFLPKEGIEVKEAFGRFLEREANKSRISLERLSSGTFLVDSYEESGGEDDPTTTVRYWKLAQLADDGSVRVALFSHSRDSTDDVSVGEADRAIRSATVSTDDGIVPS